MSGNHFESVLEALSFFPLLGRIIRKVWKLLQSNPNKQPINDIDISDAIADNSVIVNQNAYGNAESASNIAVAQGSGSVVVIKQLILLLSREPDAVSVVQQLVSQYPDDSDLGYQVCRYAVHTLSSLPNAASVIEVEPNRSYWAALERMIKDNQGRGRPPAAEDDDAEKDA